MKLQILSKGKDRVKIEVQGESHTLLNLLREKSWNSGADQVSYMIEHPYLSQPNILVKAKNPKKVLDDACQLIINETKSFQREFKRISRSK